MKKILLAIVVLAFSVVAHAQNEYLQAAEKYFSKGDYYSASQYYEKYLAGGKTRPAAAFNPYAISAVSTKAVSNTTVNRQTVLYKLAESYRLLHDHEQAAPNHKQVISLGTV